YFLLTLFGSFPSTLSLIFVVALFIPHVPVRQENYSRGEPLLLARFFPLSHSNVVVFGIAPFCQTASLEISGPFFVSLIILMKIPEKQPVEVDPREHDFGTIFADHGCR